LELAVVFFVGSIARASATISAPTEGRLVHSNSLQRLLTTTLTWLRARFTISPIWYVYAGPKSRFSSHTAMPVASSTS